MSGIRIRVNGRPREVEAGTPVSALLAELGLDERMVVVEHNRRILRRNEHEDVSLDEGDRLEVVHFVGGG